MTCPYCEADLLHLACEADLLHLAWKYWSGTGGENFELICPECGNSVVVVARLEFDVLKLEDM